MGQKPTKSALRIGIGLRRWSALRHHIKGGHFPKSASGDASTSNRPPEAVLRFKEIDRLAKQDRGRSRGLLDQHQSPAILAGVGIVDVYRPSAGAGSSVGSFGVSSLARVALNSAR